jgi:hypothetical protein
MNFVFWGNTVKTRLPATFTTGSFALSPVEGSNAEGHINISRITSVKDLIILKTIDLIVEKIGGTPSAGLMFMNAPPCETTFLYNISKNTTYFNGTAVVLLV